MPKPPSSTPVFGNGSSITVTSANQFSTQAAFEDHILSSLLEVDEYHEFVFTDVPPLWGDPAFQLTGEEIPSR